MKNYIKLLVGSFLFILCTIGAFAQERSYEDLKNVALNFTKTQSSIKHKVKEKQVKFRKTATDVDKEYRIINLDPQGWVIVSKDDIAKPILAYSLTGSIRDERSLSPAFNDWMKGINTEIVKAKEDYIDNDTYIDEWENLTTEPKVFDKYKVSKKSKSTISSTSELLLEYSNIHWYQDYPYNMYTPNNDPVGCVATAWAQIMAYHKWPSRGKGKHTYNHKNYGKLSANFNKKYNWVNMTNHDKGQISYDLGVALHMYYTPQGSSAFTIGDNIRKYFKYALEEPILKSNMHANSWAAKIRYNIDHRMPIVYSGKPEGKGVGHAFVLDGYDNSNNYHFNFGWGGGGDGFYSLNAVLSYSFGQRAVFGIKPIGKKPSTSVKTFGSYFQNYKTNQEISKTVEFPNASRIKVTISGKTDSFSDLLLVYRLNGNLSTLVKKLKGSINTSFYMTGSTVKVKLSSAGIGYHRPTKFGVKITVKDASDYTPSREITPPSHFKTTKITSNSATVTWRDNSNNETGFILRRYIETNLPANSRRFVLKNLNFDTKYTFGLYAYNKKSLTLEKYLTFRTNLYPPVGFKAIQVNANFVTLVWRDVIKGKKVFRIYRNGKYIKSLPEGTTTFTDRGVKPGKTYTYTIKSYIDSRHSNDITIKVKTKKKNKNNDVPITDYIMN